MLSEKGKKMSSPRARAPSKALANLWIPASAGNDKEFGRRLDMFGFDGAPSKPRLRTLLLLTTLSTKAHRAKSALDPERTAALWP